MIGLLLQAYNLCNAWVSEDDPEYVAWRKALEAYFLSQGVTINWDAQMHSSTLTTDYTRLLGPAPKQRSKRKVVVHAGR